MTNSLIAVVGRPNVGKSTFFNKIAGRRISIVEDTPGVTRDRLYMDCEWLGKRFTLIDTGGLEPNSEEPISKQIRRQAYIAIETCDVILFFVDGRTGLTSDDEDIAVLLRKSNLKFPYASFCAAATDAHADHGYLLKPPPAP